MTDKKKTDNLIAELTYKISIYEQYGLYTDILNLLKVSLDMAQECKAMQEIREAKDDLRALLSREYSHKIDGTANYEKLKLLAEQALEKLEQSNKQVNNGQKT